jgi:adenylate cyclase
LFVTFSGDNITVMPLEIERKFLVIDDSWRDHVHTVKKISQGYLANTDKCSIRVRVSEDNANINIKSMTIDIVRSEYEYPIPVNEAETILNSLCHQPLICKTRHYLSENGAEWEVDVFEGENAGLIIAEIELESRNEVVDKPAWLGHEVSGQMRYFNMSLAVFPYSRWRDN